MKNVFFMAEIDLNKRGGCDNFEKLADLAVSLGCDALKIIRRKQNEDAVLAFLNQYCKDKHISWLSASQNMDSYLALVPFSPRYHFIESENIADLELLNTVSKDRQYTFLSVDPKSNPMEDIDTAVDIFKNHNCPLELMHAGGIKNDDDMRATLETLKNRYNLPVGCSSRSASILSTLGAVALGATSIVRKITVLEDWEDNSGIPEYQPLELEMLLGKVREVEDIALAQEVK